MAPAAIDTTAVIAGPSTSVLPPPPVERRVERAGPAPVPAEVYRRRRAGVILALALVALAVIAFLVLANAGDDDSPANVAVPNVEGRSVADATRALTDAGLRSEVTDRQAPATADRVVDQDPDAGTMVSRDSTVTLFVPRAVDAPNTSRQPTTSAPTTTTTPPTTAAPTTQAPATTVTTRPPPTTSIVVPTTSVNPPTTRL